MQQPVDQGRTCARCGYRTPSLRSHSEIGWDPSPPEGWICPACARLHARWVEICARWLIELAPHRRWVGTADHAPHTCPRCDVVRRAQEIVLSAPAWR